MLYYIVTGFLIIHYCFDTHYFVRMILHSLVARFVSKKVKMMEPSNLYWICMTQDVDINLNHMNNARYLREFDFGRIAHALRTKFYDDVAIKRRAMFYAAGVTIRYRLPLKLLTPYKVVTTPIWWNEKFFFFDQQIVGLKDGIVRAAAYTKIAATISIEEYMKEAYPEIERPPVPEDIEKWLESQEISRTNMNKLYNRKTD